MYDRRSGTRFYRLFGRKAICRVHSLVFRPSGRSGYSTLHIASEAQPLSLIYTQVANIFQIMYSAVVCAFAIVRSMGPISRMRMYRSSYHWFVAWYIRSDRLMYTMSPRFILIVRTRCSGRRVVWFDTGTGLSSSGRDADSTAIVFVGVEQNEGSEDVEEIPMEVVTTQQE